MGAEVETSVVDCRRMGANGPVTYGKKNLRRCSRTESEAGGLPPNYPSGLVCAANNVGAPGGDQTDTTVNSLLYEIGCDGGNSGDNRCNRAFSCTRSAAWRRGFGVFLVFVI